MKAMVLLVAASILLAGCHHRHQGQSTALAKGNRFSPATIDFQSQSAKIANLYYTQRNPRSIAQTMDLYIPLNKDAKPPYPVVIWIHGGAWLYGDKNADVLAAQLLAKRYAVASLNYRLTNEAAFPAQIYDVKAAVRFLRQNAKKYKLDENAIGVWGVSAGGYLAALLGTSGSVKELEGSGGYNNKSSRVQAVVDWCGPTDLNTAQSQAGPNNKLRFDGPGTAVYSLMGTRMDKESLAKASPVTYVSKDDPPFLIMHGDQDDAIPPAQSEELYQALQGKGCDVTYHLLPGYGHSFAYPEHLQLVENFFDRTLTKSKSK